MASGWMKSLQCKSRAVEDVLNPNPKFLIPSSSCRKSAQSIKDVIETAATTHHRRQYHRKPIPFSPNHTKAKSKPKPRPESVSAPPSRSHSTRNPNADPNRNPHPLFPALTEVPDGHPSRNVVEIIFHTSWSNKSFPGRIEMIFKVHNGSKTGTRFEEYREMVKTRAGLSGGSTWEENARCVADGNEMMRFYCLGPAGDARGGAWVFPAGKGAAICTFSGSGPAHESAGGGNGRRAMLVCRVIAGRVSKQIELEDGRVGFDSVSGVNGELLVFDPHAVLPCFLIIYKL
ncbi:zinc finger (C2H2 type) family protein [Euphorbia peplus]|nr:zinc finger (C2H2 type) family protein [Euphorbia peplus]